MSIRIEFSPLKDFTRYLEVAPAIATQAMRIAINYTVGEAGLKIIRAAMYKENAFPAGYLEGSDKLFTSKQASDFSLEGRIQGRARATSLARYALSTALPTPKGQGVTVAVNPGQPKFMPGAFLVRLNKGSSLDEDNYNVGLAVRLKPGQTLIPGTGRQATTFLSPNVILLYGPSVDQVASDVFQDQADTLADMASVEFSRQFVRLA